MCVTHCSVLVVILNIVNDNSLPIPASKLLLVFFGSSLGWLLPLLKFRLMALSFTLES